MMELLPSHIPFSIYLTTFFLFLFLLLKLLIGRSTSKLPPGPRTLPLIGNIHQLLSPLPPHRRLKQLADEYGPIMHLKLGEVSNIIVTSPETAKEILKTHDLNFSDRPVLSSSAVISYNCRDLAFSQHGDYWRQLRKICTIELLTPKRVQSFRSIREEEVSKLVKKIAASEGSVFNLSKSIYSLTYGITARAAFGKKCRLQDEFIFQIDEELLLLGGLSVADLYPSVKVLQMIGNRKIKRVHKEVDRILQDIVEEHKNTERRNNSEGEEDLVDVLLRFQPEKESEYPLTDINVKAIIHDIFIAGGETSSAVVEWGMSELIKNPRVMKKAQEEVRRVYDSKGYVDETCMHQLKYLKCVVKETLRLHPSLPLLIPKANRERCQINGYEIPAKTRIMVNAWAIGRDPKYWTDAESFKPERFLDNSMDFRGTEDFEYIPFGAGRRMCPGISFGIPNVELPLAQILFHFDWNLPNGLKNEELDMAELTGITVKRLNHLCLIPVTIHRP